MNPASSQFAEEVGSISDHDEIIQIDQPSTSLHQGRLTSSEILKLQLPTCLIEGASGTSSKGGNEIRVTIDEVLKGTANRHEVSNKADQDSADDPNREIQVEVTKGGEVSKETTWNKRSEVYRTSGPAPPSPESDTSKEVQSDNVNPLETKIREFRRKSLAYTSETKMDNLRHPSTSETGISRTGIADQGPNASDTGIGDHQRPSTANASETGRRRASIAAGDLLKRNVLRLPKLRKFSSEEDSVS